MRRWLTGAALGTCVGLGGAVLALTPAGNLFERSVGLPLLFRQRGPIQPPDEVVVVGINGQTGADLGLPSLPIQWPRTVHGELIAELTRRNASLIVFDVHFASTKSAAEDAAFARAIRDSGRVLLLEKLVGRKQPLLDAAGRQRGSLWTESVDPPLPQFVEGSVGLGPFPLPKLGAAVYEFWTFKSGAGDAPTLPAAALQLYAERRGADWRAGLSGMDLAGARSADGADPAALRYRMQQLRTAAGAESPSAPALPLAGALAEVARDPDPLLSALAALYTKPGVRYLNFYGPPGTIATVPYQAVVRAARDPSATLPQDFSGKVAFVGYSDLYDPGQPDRFYTVFTGEDGVDLSGVEIAATSFANLLTDRSLDYPGPAATAISLLLFGLAAALLAYLLPAAWGVPLSLALAAAYGMAALHSFETRDLWLPLATPLLAQLPAALFAGLFAQYFTERRRSARVSAAISYYLPEQIARDLARQTLDPSALNKVVFGTCLATDMAGFSTIAEKLPPGELAAFLNEYFEGLSRPLREHGVGVTEFRADAIMCAWTAPSPQLSVRRRAVLAALGAAAAITEFKRRHPILTSPLRIGLEAGSIYVGHAGGGGHFVYSIVGDCANTASRIESLNKHLGSQVLASGDTVAGLEDILTRPLGRFQLLGKSEPVAVVEIIALRAQATADQLRRCELFAAALARAEAADWAAARQLFDALLAHYPDDGPAAFHRARCARYLQDPATAPQDAGLVLMTEK
ncbi:MAG: CHASE2 domain-containing protein [Pseudomonadota bacterium]